MNYLPTVAQALEALLAGILTAGAVHQSGGDATSTVVAGLSALLAKYLPPQITPPKP